MLGTAVRALASAGFQSLPVGQCAPCFSCTFDALICHVSAHGLITGAAVAHQRSSGGFRDLSTTGSEQQSSPDKDASTPGSAAPTAATSLQHLLQASSQRIAEGKVGELADADASAVAAALSAGLEQLLPPPPQAAAAAAPYNNDGDEDARVLEQRLSVTQADATEAAAPAPVVPYHRRYGYAALGGGLPSEDAAVAGAVGGAAGGLLGSIMSTSQPRIHPRRRFMPGSMYEPQDLNPFAAGPADSGRRHLELRPGVEEVKQKADYKNVAFLTRWFLSPAGRLLPRSQTRLPAALHRHVSRQVRLARHMGLIPGEARLDKLHLPRLREQELEEAQARAAERGGRGAGRPHELLDFGA